MFDERKTNNPLFETFSGLYVSPFTIFPIFPSLTTLHPLGKFLNSLIAQAPQDTRSSCFERFLAQPQGVKSQPL